MNNFSNSGALKMAFAIIVISAICASPASASVSEFLNRIDARSKALRSLKANLKMGQFNPQTEDIETREGALMFVAKTKTQNYLFRLDWKKPVEYITVKNGVFEAFKPQTNIAHTGAADTKTAQSKGGGAFSFLQMSKKQLQDEYTPLLIGTESLSGSVTVARIKFTPKKTSKYKFLEIWVDVDGVIHQARTTSTSGDETTYRLTNIKDNINVNTEEFDIKVPTNVKWVRV